MVTVNTSESTLSTYIYNSSSSYYLIGQGRTIFRIKPGKYTMLFDYMNNLDYKTITVNNNSSQNISINIVNQFSKNDATNALVKLLPQYGPGLEYSIKYSYSFVSGVAMPQITISYTTQKSLNDALYWIASVGANYNSLNISQVQVTTVPFN